MASPTIDPATPVKEKALVGKDIEDELFVIDQFPESDRRKRRL